MAVHNNSIEDYEDRIFAFYSSFEKISQNDKGAGKQICQASSLQLVVG